VTRVTDINYLQRRFTHRQSEGVAHEKPSRVFRLLILTATFLLASAFALPQKAPNWAGWYTTAQAANGAKAYQKTCASCHGATLQGAMGPAVVGRQFWLTYAGKKVSTRWSPVHTTMPMTAPGSVSARNSINIMAYRLQKNGVPAGSTPLNDAADLSKALPAN